MSNEKIKDEMYWRKIILDLSTEKEQRIQAAFHLENAVEEESIDALCKALMTEPSPIVRHEIAFSLGETAHFNSAKYLMLAVEKDKNSFVRHEAILALATLGKKEFAPFIKKFVNDSNVEVAESAEIALQRIYS